MGLTQAQRSLIEKARSVGNSDLATALTDEMCAFLVGVIVRDLELLPHFPELPADLPAFFSAVPPDRLQLHGADFWHLLERLVGLTPDADTYFSCLATLHKARLKYARILQSQPIPTMDQVGPRGLLQYGQMSPAALAGFIRWRKWLFDIDNRAGQETGYLFEPIIAHAIGGVPASAGRSPVRRADDPKKGRQVDCIRQQHAYEIKIRVTIASSGQGRWREELAFPTDCRASGFVPVLIVFDPTPNDKLAELRRAFEAAGGEVYIGQDAWRHLDQEAGATMARFIETYVRAPIDALLREVVGDQLPDIRFSMDTQTLVVTVAAESFAVHRTAPRLELADDEPGLPDDVDE